MQRNKDVGQITVNRELCIQDGACMAVCPHETLGWDKEGYPEENPESGCILCGHCVAVCTTGALTHAGLPQEPFLPMPQDLPTPAAIDNLLIGRRSVREFEPEPVARETLERLLDVARRAPTASNSQKLHWIVVQGKENVRALSEEAVAWMRSAECASERMKAWDRGSDFVMRGAPTAVVACTPDDHIWGRHDCSIALTFLELAAEARGLGVCWAGFLVNIAREHAPLRLMLAVPKNYRIHGALMLGRPKVRYHSVPPRNPLSVQWNK
jgi:nitroreductase/NAD-dependent dihydropyrimidine dehydrogenase PreA subunit